MSRRLPSTLAQREKILKFISQSEKNVEHFERLKIYYSMRAESCQEQVTRLKELLELKEPDEQTPAS
jgi:plasmid rolling circle replication initiator protein Rep